MPEKHMNSGSNPGPQWTSEGKLLKCTCATCSTLVWEKFRFDSSGILTKQKLLAHDWERQLKKKPVFGNELNALILSDFTKSQPVRHKDFSEAHFEGTYQLTVFRSACTSSVKVKVEHVRTG